MVVGGGVSSGQSNCVSCDTDSTSIIAVMMVCYCGDDGAFSPVDDAFGVKELQSHYDLSAIEPEQKERRGN